MLTERALLVPMRDLATNALLGAQIIWLEDNRWQKRMLPEHEHGALRAHAGQRWAPEIWLVEGYATGLSVERALHQLRLNASVMVCFSATNLMHVAGLVDARKCVSADNDESRTGEQAAVATGLPWVMSPIFGEDANDLHRRAGLLAVCKLVMAARSQRSTETAR